MTTSPKCWENKWTTAMGAYVPGERVVLRGKDLLTELNGLDWMALLLYGVTGRIPHKKQVRLLNAIWSLAASYPDPRLWNNRIGTLAGVARSTGALGVSAGIAVTEAVVYGHQTVLGAVQLLLDIKHRRDDGETLADILAQKMAKRPGESRTANGKRRKIPNIPGFGRPVSSRDERIGPLMDVVRQLGYDEMPMIKLAFEIESQLLPKHPRMYLNVGGLIAALYCDQGFTIQQQYYLSVLYHSAGIVFCALDATEHPEGSFFPLRCDRIRFPQRASRQW